MNEKLQFHPISDSEYAIWVNQSNNEYREEMIKNGLTFEEAQKKTDDAFRTFLPEGSKSKDNYIYTIKVESRWVGTIWFCLRGAPNNRKAFICDIVLDEKERGKGFGKQAMLMLEEEVKKHGLKHIGLHVFGHNKIARNLYQSLGYEITNLYLEKALS
ncbi:MAG: GNAT family N-acetyltransferase [Bdellovibrio sp.]|nr:GNAT family N-acetyltransferase [Bdellovibrio sp.]